MLKKIRLLIHAFQGLLLLSIVVLERLTYTKALVMRHVYQKRIFYEKVINSYDLISIITGVLIVLIIINLLLYWQHKQKNIKTINGECKWTLLINIVFICVLKMAYFKEMNTYIYLLMVMTVILIVQWFLWIALKVLSSKN